MTFLNNRIRINRQEKGTRDVVRYVIWVRLSKGPMLYSDTNIQGGPVDGDFVFYICCWSMCWVDIICGGAITCPVPMPVVGIRIEAAVMLVIGLLVNPFVKPFDM